MKKTILYILVSIILFSPVSLAIPNGEMTFGGMSEVNVQNDFKAFWQQAYPEMKKTFGQPYSSFTFTIEVIPGLSEGGWDATNKKVIELESVQDKQNAPNVDYETAKDMAFPGLLHESSHAMYTYDNKIMGFFPQWINEGWAKTTEIITWMNVKGEPPNPRIYLTEFLDKDTVAGTESWGLYKQRRNHVLVYDSTNLAHLNLLYSCSDSNSNPDFQKRMNEKIYDEYVLKGKLNEFSKLPLEEYKKLIKELCADRKIDGKDAYEWYFSQPITLTQGTTGFHIGVFPHYWAYTTVEGIDVFTFNRVDNTKDKDKSEKGISTKAKVDVFDSKGNKVYSKETTTDQDGNAFLNFGRDFLKDGSYYVIAEADYNSKKYQSKMFFMSLRTKDGTAEEQAGAQTKNEALGILVDKDLKPLDSRYISVLKPIGDAKITANSNGLFKAHVPTSETKEISFDFLGETFVFTKPPFRRIVILKISDDLIGKAEQTQKFKEFVDKGFVEGYQVGENIPGESEIKEMNELKELKGTPTPPPRKTIFHWLIEKLTRLFGFG